MGFFDDPKMSLEELDAMLAEVEIKPEKKKKVSSFEISRNCAWCGKETHVPRAENPYDKGEYTGVICTRCYEEEMENYKREEEYDDFLREMQSLRDQGVVVLKDHMDKDPKG